MKKQSKVRRSSAGNRESQQPLMPQAVTEGLPWRAPADSRSALPRAGAIVFIVAACLVCLGYTLYTDQTWEDSLITLRHSENLIKGEGLTFNPGGRVHGFTSPINVLLLAACHLLTGQSSYVATLWLYRIFTVAAFAASGVLLLKAVFETSPRWTSAVLFLGVFYLFDVKSVAFSTNGMETGFMLLFVGWAVYLMSRAAPDQWLVRGLCWSGLMWSRPDACVYIAALSLAELIFLSASRRATFVSLVKSAAVCSVVYGPWVVWAWSYYGSPIPHTIIAKTNIEQGAKAQLLAAMDNYLAALISIAAQAFRPIYYGEQISWLGNDFLARVLNGSTKFVGVVALFYFIYPVKDRFGRAMSLSFAITCSYFTYMTRAYPWYFPPVTMLGAVAFTRAVTTMATGVKNNAAANAGARYRRPVLLATLIFLAAGEILLFWPASLEQRIFQAEVENGNRAVIGEWLKVNASPNENVYLEPLGYIGYFSGLHIDDYPGLVSPEVVRLRHQLPSNAQAFDVGRLLLIPILKPDWVVLRFDEYRIMAGLPMFEEFRKGYTKQREFNVHDNLSKYKYLPGESYLRFDASFAVFRKVSSGG